MNDLPRGWARTTIGAVCRIVSGSTPRSGESRYWGEQIPWITPDDLSKHTSKVIARGRRSLTAEGYASCSTQMVPVGSVLFTSRAPIGYVAIASQPVCTNQGFKSLVPPEGLFPDYLYWYMRYATDEVRSRASGTTFSEISGRVMAEVPLLLAPRHEQERIVAAIEAQFSRLDVGVAALDGASAKAGTLSNAAMGAAVSKWDLVPLRDLVRSLRNGIFVSRPGIAPTQRAILRISAVRPLKLDAADVRYVPESTALRNEDAFRIEAGDLLFTRYNGSADLVGACAMVGVEAAGLLYPDKLIRAVVNRSRALPDYLEIALNCGPSLRAIAQRRRTTAGQVGIAGSQLLGIPVPLPPVEDQGRIVAEARTVLDASRVVRLELAAARRRCAGLRSAILAAAFSGGLVPQDATDEPAPILLERIASQRTPSNGHNATRIRSRRSMSRTVLA